MAGRKQDTIAHFCSWKNASSYLGKCRKQHEAPKAWTFSNIFGPLQKYGGWWFLSDIGFRGGGWRMGMRRGWGGRGAHRPLFCKIYSEINQERNFNKIASDHTVSMSFCAFVSSAKNCHWESKSRASAVWRLRRSELGKLDLEYAQDLNGQKNLKRLMSSLILLAVICRITGIFSTKQQQREWAAGGRNWQD